MALNSRMMVVAFLTSLFLVATDEVRESGAMEVVYEPVFCVTTPCPQFKIIEINGDKPKENMGADISDLDLKTLPIRKPFLIIGTWVREGDYFKVTPKEVIITSREKVKPQLPATESKDK